MVLPGERILVRQRPHALLLLVPLFLLLIAFVVFVVVFCPNAHALGVDGRCLPIAALAVITTASLVFLEWWLTLYTLTTQRIIKEQGIIGRQIIEVALEDVEDVTVKQDIGGRIFGYGDLLMESAGRHGQVAWLGIAHPLQVRQRVVRAVDGTKRQMNG